jgi:tRNA(Ile)-lysidine synthase
MTENTLEEQIYQFIKEKNLLKAGDVCIVGVSGGADSICLLTVLAGLREKMDLKLYAVHVNHMIRGTEADADESYVAEYCKKLGIPCDCYHIDVPQLAKKQKLTEEEVGVKKSYLLHAGLSGNGTVTTKTAIIKQSTLIRGNRKSKDDKG